MGAGGNGHLEDPKLAGGNTIRVYKPNQLPKLLDKAEKLDLAVVADIPIPKAIYPEFYEDPEKFAQIKSGVKNLIAEFKDHPALLYWNLGNEILYSNITEQTVFFSRYNELIEMIHNLDPNHPVSTSVIGGNRRRLVSIALKSPELDFLSFNTFGNLNELKERLESVSVIWNGPFVISEWGIHGPWEENVTDWGAPIEPSSTKKAEKITHRYQEFIQPLENGKCLGNIIFFWGNKQERTSTWFSIFSEDGKKSEQYQNLKKIWRGDTTAFQGPKLDVVLLNGKSSDENIIILPGSQNDIQLFPEPKNSERLNYHWEIKKEAWFNSEKRPGAIEEFNTNTPFINFEAPSEEGPYRIFIHINDSLSNFATANIPFYILNSEDE